MTLPTGQSPVDARPEALTALAARGRVHLIGVGGAGMSAVAGLLVARGLQVSGSDARGGPLVEALRAVGVRVHVGHDPMHVAGAGTVVVSTAIRSDNAELSRATELGLVVRHRSAVLATLMDGHRSVAVAGAHGKTTTSAMIAVLLDRVGLAPSWVIGGTVRTAVGEPVRTDVGGGHHGTGDVLVAEADESDGSFLAYCPTIAVVTNVEPDHLDHYGSRAAFEQAFRAFVGRVPAGGHLVACLDDEGARALVADARAGGVQVVTYGTDPGADVRVGPWRPSAGRTGGTTWLQEGGGPRVELTLAVPGEHNALNAAAAWSVARLLGVGAAAAAAALGSFAGTGRRFEDRGSAGGVRVVDDYAHHPTEVAALLRAARQEAGAGRVLVLFQPHLFSRTKAFADEFAAALDLADVVVVTEVYAAREDPDPLVSGAMVVDRMHGAGTFVADRTAAAQHLGSCARPGDLVLTVGAGDVTELAPVVLAAVPVR